MASYGSNNRGGYNSNNRSGPGTPRQLNSNAPAPKEIKPEALPANYVDIAEEIMGELVQNRKCISTSKIRNLLSFASEIYNVEKLRTEEELLPESIAKLSMMRVRTAYECGRDADTKDFVVKARLLEYIKGIGKSRAAMMDFAHYMEALVAYHRFFGGKEN